MTDITPEHRAELERIGSIVTENRSNWMLRLGDRFAFLVLTHTSYGFWICQDRDRLHEGRGDSPLAAYSAYLRGRSIKAWETIAASEAELARIGAEVES